MFIGVDGCLRTVFQVQFTQDIADMGLDSLLADDESLGDFPVAHSLGDEL
jgi:hypothetical protein